MLSALSINKSFAIGMAILAVGFWCGTSYAQDEPASFNSSFLMGSLMLPIPCLNYAFISTNNGFASIVFNT